MKTSHGLNSDSMHVEAHLRTCPVKSSHGLNRDSMRSLEARALPATGSKVAGGADTRPLRRRAAICAWWTRRAGRGGQAERSAGRLVGRRPEPAALACRCFGRRGPGSRAAVNRLMRASHDAATVGFQIQKKNVPCCEKNISSFLFFVFLVFSVVTVHPAVQLAQGARSISVF